MRKNGHEHCGEQSGYHQGKAAGRPGQLAQLVGLGRADDVGGSAEGNALSHRILNFEEFT